MKRAWLVALCLIACRDPTPPATRAETVTPPGAPAASASNVPPAASVPADEVRVPKVYPWLADGEFEPKPTGKLEERFAPPPGFVRIWVEPKGYAAWLRELPVAAPDTPVRAFDGRVLHKPTDPRIAGVIALDVSKSDLQQCADTVIRLHAEWRWSQGARDMSYRAAAGMELPWSRWAKGERIVPKGKAIEWVPGSPAVDDHASFRKYLDAVFAWANTVSLEKQAKPVDFGELRAGDFFILPGNPGHAVVVLDVAKNREERAALLGQSFMPAQNLQVLRAKDGGAWFRLERDKAVDTPFWKPFPWSSLRRLSP